MPTIKTKMLAKLANYFWWVGIKFIWYANKCKSIGSVIIRFAAKDL